MIEQNYSIKTTRKYLRLVELVVACSKPSWFYSAFEREDQDPLTNYEMEYIAKNSSRDSKILNAGCGTGIVTFHLASLGFRKVVGTDLLPEAIQVAT